MSGAMSCVTAETIARALGLRRVGRGWRGPCPVHGGSSFELKEKGGKPLFYCWAGCDRGAILDILRGLGLWPRPNWTPEQKRDFTKQRALDKADLVEAKRFGDAAVILAEGLLADLHPCDLQRGPLTTLLAALRSETGILGEFRAWRARDPHITRALVRAGSAHRRRVEIMLEDYLEVRRNAA
jgi:hypothetical protein